MASLMSAADAAAAASARAYRGPVKAVIFDWAGTIVDHGSIAPVLAFVEVFKRNGVAIDVATARGPMGTNKRDHITAILRVPAVAAAWAAAHGGQGACAHGGQPAHRRGRGRCGRRGGARACCGMRRSRGCAARKGRVRG